ncbi:hypothetical protein [Isoptericola dokdonensis]|uniref:Uncharacterized protein n=1 Tax=Isoptericola dokdonensis DS-3 TaxID=1300344 RepID=A0A168FM89_9MICO|nr:hypothetical protein [Isoptericola dokdonensis]ANC32119.1 hypothetical protein I598_2585 [Isoptericola dokdonensis DS-3]
MRSPLIDQLSGLDPARHVRAPGGRDDAELHDILSTDRHVRVRRKARPGMVAATAAGAVVAVGVAVSLSSVLGAVPAYASWTPVPAVVADPLQVALDAGCPTSATEIVGEGADADIAEVALTPVLAETRGDYTYVVLTGDDAAGDCFVSATDDVPDVYASSSVGTPLPVPGAREVTVAVSGTASWSAGDAGEGAVTSAYGRAGTDVVEVTAVLDDGEQVVASVEGGWWALWAPGEESFGADVQVTFTDGTTTQVALAP